MELSWPNTGLSPGTSESLLVGGGPYAATFGALAPDRRDFIKIPSDKRDEVESLLVAHMSDSSGASLSLAHRTSGHSRRIRLVVNRAAEQQTKPREPREHEIGASD